MNGQKELQIEWRKHLPIVVAVGAFSLFTNLLMLTGPLYMLQVYDRVLASGSSETLVALSVLLLFLYAVMGTLDYSRIKSMQRVGWRFYNALEKRVYDASLRKAAVLPDARTRMALDDLNIIRQAFGSSGLLAFFDLPWTPVFFVIIFLFHPFLGLAALVGAVILVGITFANQRLSKRSRVESESFDRAAKNILTQLHDEADMVRAAGMQSGGYDRFQRQKDEAVTFDVKAAEYSSGFSTLTKTLRLFLQSAILGLAAWLVIGGHMTVGGMIAGSLLLGRALAPIEALLNQWANLHVARQSWDQLSTLLGEVPPDALHTNLPPPAADLSVENLIVVPPGERQAVLKGISFSIGSGEAMGVIGSSGAGKTSLARALAGVWPPVGGHIRLDGAALDQYQPEALGMYLGYLPQRVSLFDGTIASNIARLAAVPDDLKIVTASKIAGAHEMILALPQGYDTPVSAHNTRLSGGQLQRIGLARALYDDPVLVILDEPNSNLDSEGSAALNEAIVALKARGRAVLIMAHRPAAIKECDTLLVLDGGTASAYGPRDKVLQGMVKNVDLFTPKAPDSVAIQ